jgi:hypothetical protein
MRMYVCCRGICFFEWLVSVVLLLSNRHRNVIYVGMATKELFESFVSASKQKDEADKLLAKVEIPAEHAKRCIVRIFFRCLLTVTLQRYRELGTEFDCIRDAVQDFGHCEERKLENQKSQLRHIAKKLAAGEAAKTQPGAETIMMTPTLHYIDDLMKRIRKFRDDCKRFVDEFKRSPAYNRNVAKSVWDACWTRFLGRFGLFLFASTHHTL